MAKNRSGVFHSLFYIIPTIILISQIRTSMQKRSNTYSEWEKGPEETEFKTHGEHSYGGKKRSQNVCCCLSLSQLLRMNENGRPRKKHCELERLSCCHGACALWAVGLWAWENVQMTRT